MILKPKFTEKSLRDSQVGRYTFRVPVTLYKGAAKKEIEDLFKVKVASIWSSKNGGEVKQSGNRHRRRVSRQKTVVVTLREGKLDFFDSPEESKTQKNPSEEEAKKVIIKKKEVRSKKINML